MIAQTNDWYVLSLSIYENDEDDEEKHVVGISRVAAWAFQDDDDHMIGVALVPLQTKQGAMLIDAYDYFDHTVLVHAEDYSKTHPTSKWREIYLMFHSKDDEVRAPAVDAVTKALAEVTEDHDGDGDGED